MLRAALMAWTVPAWAALVLGCSDGYPTDDVPQLAPSTMNSTQLLQALNELGAEPHLGQRWRYTLAPGCQLEVRVQQEAGGRQRVALQGASVESSSSDGQIGVRVVPEDAGAEAEGVTVLQTRRWTDSVRARSLLTQLEMRCADGQA